MTAPPADTVYEVTILLIEQFAMITFSSTVEPLREANWVAGRRVFKWTIVSNDGCPVRASNGLTVSVNGSIHDVQYSPMVIVCSSHDPHLYATSDTFAWLRQIARWGANVGAVETGAYVLARAGLLNNYHATIHWENADSFAEEFPKVKLTDRIFEIDRKRFSASGAAAALDMMLYFIGERVGRNVAARVAEEFIYNRMREAQISQRLDASERLNTRKPRLRRLLAVLDSHLFDRLDIGKMASAEGISEREVRRLFRVYLGKSPQAYHRTLRLKKARMMLRQSDLSISDIANNCGFTSGSDFSRAFKRQFGTKPLDERGTAYSSDRSVISSFGADPALRERKRNRPSKS